MIVRNLIFEGSFEFAGDSHDPVGFNDVLLRLLPQSSRGIQQIFKAPLHPLGRFVWLIGHSRN